MIESWYVVETHPRKESYAERHLRNQGYRTFCPRLTKLAKVGRVRRLTNEPLFPGYLFVSFDLQSHGWRSINGTRGVRGLLAANPYHPNPMPVCVMKKLFADDGFEFSEAEISPGSSVKFVSGPLIDRVAIVHSLPSRTRVSLLLEIMGGVQHIEAARSQLLPV